ncbi:MAG: hypothetical protein HYW26_04465 [Candidatus Aenigmarchaeota archaeon]|nr:hypothetical protein [Candidatus Aenigmarchaeota archaeon]
MAELLSRIEWKNVALLAAALALVAVYAKLFAVVLLIAGVVFVSFIVQQFSLRTVGLELVTFATVVSGIVYGPVVGAALGAVLVLIHLVFSGYFGVYYFWVIPVYAFGGFLASAWSGQGVVSLGINITLVIHAINMAFTFALNRNNMFNYGLYAVTNVVFNFILFVVFGQAVVGILK